jgi:ssDNA-binding Zn-finger/Zn-ribbon topoisomerase 1
MIICSVCGKPYRHVKNHGKSRWACPTYIIKETATTSPIQNEVKAKGNRTKNEKALRNALRKGFRKVFYCNSNFPHSKEVRSIERQGKTRKKIA